MGVMGDFLPAGDAEYVLRMSFVNGDQLQIALHRREDILRWLRQCDHEGSSWSVIRIGGFVGSHTHSTPLDITDEIAAEYAGGR